MHRFSVSFVPKRSSDRTLFIYIYIHILFLAIPFFLVDLYIDMAIYQHQRNEQYDNSVRCSFHLADKSSSAW